jgi:hypothetical protein
MRICLAVVALCAGCATFRADPELNCTTVRDDPRVLDRASLTDLKRLAYGSPAEHAANSAYAQRIANIGLRAAGTAALAAGLISGFAANPATQPGVRTAGYGLIGGAIGVFALSFVFDYTIQRSATDARLRLREWSATHCPAGAAALPEAP